LTAALYTEKNLGFVNLSAFYRVNGNTQVGSLFRFDLDGKNPRTMTTACEHKLDKDTVIKAKAELPAGAIGVAYEQKLANPKVSINVAAQFNPNKSFNAEKFGLGLSFGDF